MNNEILPEEAVNLPPLNRFRYREAKMVFDDNLLCHDWVVRCGHQSPNEHVGYGPTLAQAIFNAGIDS
jgi:hypothetical protein